MSTRKASSLQGPDVLALDRTKYLHLSPSVLSPLASVPWVAQWKFNNDGNDSIGSNHLTNNNSATFTTGLSGGTPRAVNIKEKTK